MQVHFCQTCQTWRTFVLGHCEACKRPQSERVADTFQWMRDILAIPRVLATPVDLPKAYQHAFTVASLKEYADVAIVAD